jgi:hypothetical protein
VRLIARLCRTNWREWPSESLWQFVAVIAALCRISPAFAGQRFSWVLLCNGGLLRTGRELQKLAVIRRDGPTGGVCRFVSVMRLALC